jgi:hypothetical protein
MFSKLLTPNYKIILNKLSTKPLLLPTLNLVSSIFLKNGLYFFLFTAIKRVPLSLRGNIKLSHSNPKLQGTNNQMKHSNYFATYVVK